MKTAATYAGCVLLALGVSAALIAAWAGPIGLALLAWRHRRRQPPGRHRHGR